jgi:hypothetical protein
MASVATKLLRTGKAPSIVGDITRGAQFDLKIDGKSISEDLIGINLRCVNNCGAFRMAVWQLFSAEARSGAAADANSALTQQMTTTDYKWESGNIYGKSKKREVKKLPNTR